MLVATSLMPSFQPNSRRRYTARAGHVPRTESTRVEASLLARAGPMTPPTRRRDGRRLISSLISFNSNVSQVWVQGGNPWLVQAAGNSYNTLRSRPASSRIAFGLPSARSSPW